MKFFLRVDRFESNRLELEVGLGAKYCWKVTRCSLVAGRIIMSLCAIECYSCMSPVYNVTWQLAGYDEVFNRRSQLQFTDSCYTMKSRDDVHVDSCINGRGVQGVIRGCESLFHKYKIFHNESVRKYGEWPCFYYNISTFYDHKVYYDHPMKLRIITCTLLLTIELRTLVNRFGVAVRDQYLP
uniref:Ricin B-type lectin domain-containing protein n=1 Tax=Syphacia muris TaxID=451379 RepID=A0A158R4K7_9BILA